MATEAVLSEAYLRGERDAPREEVPNRVPAVERALKLDEFRVLSEAVGGGLSVQRPAS